jgi:HCOMODA/2-hydroxy-3-carboxy-muconic semialdehyde decarboxylase
MKLKRRSALWSVLALSLFGQPLDVAAATPKSPRDAVIADLVTANHILSYTGVLDAFGHVSVRDPDAADQFLMARDLAPAQVTADDLITYDLDAKAIDKPNLHGHSERYIHAAVYRARHDVGAVVHSHSPSVVPFGMSPVPLRAVYHMAGFLAHGVPVYDIRKFFGDGTNMLVNNAQRGETLAKVLGPLPVVLMRGHGDTVVGPGVRRATVRAVYTEIGARIQAQAMAMAPSSPLEFLTPAEGDAFEGVGPNGALTDKDEGTDRSWNMWAAALRQQAGNAPGT